MVFKWVMEVRRKLEVLHCPIFGVVLKNKVLPKNKKKK